MVALLFETKLENSGGWCNSNETGLLCIDNKVNGIQSSEHTIVRFF